MPQHLFVDISSHGFGHLAQTAPVLNALRLRQPDLQLTIRCGLPRARLSQRIDGRFAHIPEASDFGLSMHNALDVDVADSLARYQAFHANWEIRLQAYAQQITQFKPHLVLANISYLALAAARQVQIPALALCSLNWLDIFFPYASAAPSLSSIHTHMLDAYNSATAFLRLTPGMLMPQIQRLTEIGPIARGGAANSRQLRVLLGLAPTTRLILVSMGGIPMRLPDSWPMLPGIQWMVPRAAALPRDDMIALECIDMAFSDVLASCDCIFTKSAYGAFVEAAVCGTPVLYVERPDWPEEPCLTAWLQQHNLAQGISRAQFEQGLFGPALRALLLHPRPAPIAPTGIDEAVNFLLRQLEQLR